MKNIYVYSIAVFVLSISKFSYAWYFPEHRLLGEQAFKNACVSLMAELEKEPGNYSVLVSIPCSSIDEKARLYGLRAALSGDHIESPEKFKSISAEKQALSWITYGELALQNYEHFWPIVKDVWRKYHQQAVETALRARAHLNEGLTITAISEFESALTLSSFADHFLQDAFSIGHSGFSRINSLQNPSLIFHDDMNAYGRYLMGKEIPSSALDATLTKEQRFIELTKMIPTCATVYDRFNNFPLKPKNTDCNTAIWYAYGDGKLADSRNIANYSRIIKSNVSSIKSVILAFVKNEETGYSLIADTQLPVSTEYFKQLAIYGDAYNDRVTESKYVSSKLAEDNCKVQNADVYEVHDKCWFDIEKSFTDPVYPDVTAMLSWVKFKNIGSMFYGLYLAYSPYVPEVRFFQSIPKNLRIYYFVNLNRSDEPFFKDDNAYREIGLNFTLPNFYNGSLISHELDLAYAKTKISDSAWYKLSSDSTVTGTYLGLNTNIDMLRAKFTIGLGWFFPNSTIARAEFKGQVMLGWSFGVLGGGPLTRWKD